ncbi:MAG: HD domain-containing protein, partial [Candidatus Kapaibacterium sp.]
MASVLAVHAELISIETARCHCAVIAQRYGELIMPDTNSSNLPIWPHFWAKTDRTGERPEWTRPLWAHLFDVGNSALILWERFLPSAFRNRLIAATNLNNEEAGKWFSIQIGLHDLGKATPSFQAMHKSSAVKLRELGLNIPEHFNGSTSIHHGHASIALICSALND